MAQAPATTSANALTPIGSILPVTTTNHRAAKATNRQPMMMTAAQPADRQSSMVKVPLVKRASYSAVASEQLRGGHRWSPGRAGLRTPNLHSARGDLGRSRDGHLRGPMPPRLRKPAARSRPHRPDDVENPICDDQTDGQTGKRRYLVVRMQQCDKRQDRKDQPNTDVDPSAVGKPRLQAEGDADRRDQDQQRALHLAKPRFDDKLGPYEDTGHQGEQRDADLQRPVQGLIE